MKRKTWLALLLSAVMLLTACANEKPRGEKYSDKDKSDYSDSDNRDENDNKESDMWDVIPEIPVTDASAFAYKYDSELGGMVVTKYVGEFSEVRIPDTLEDKPVVKIGDEAFDGCTGLTSVKIPDSVTMIGGSAFYGCTSLTSITIPDSVTVITIMLFLDAKIS